MTPPRPTAPTAAELREATIQMHCDSGGCDSVRGGPPGSHDSVGCHLAGMLDDLMAAVRAEALASERERCALELDELAQEADMAAYACLGGATADTEPGEVLDGEGLSIAAATVVTAPKPSAHTAAQLRVLFGANPCQNPGHADPPCTWNQRAAQLDDLLAAARAEAVADAGDDAVELREALLSLSARPDDPNRPHINDIIGACIRAARAEAVAPLEARVAELESERGALVEADILRRARVGEVLNVLRQLMKAMPKCEWDEYKCKKVATHHAYKQQFFCAAHQFASDVQPVEWAAPLRAALALLAADKAGAKAGKP